MSKTNHRTGKVSPKDSEDRKASVWKRHSKNPQMGPPLTGSVHEVDYPPKGWNSRIRQRENEALRKIIIEDKND